MELVDGGDDLLLVAGGTGLAPLRALVEQVADAPAGRRVTLIVGARTFAGLYDAIALDKLQQAHDWLTHRAGVLRRPRSRARRAGHRDRVGEPITTGAGQHVHVCGPPAMLTAARRWLTIAGVPAERLHLPVIGER